MSIQKIDSTKIVNKIIKDRLIGLLYEDISWKVDEMFRREGIDPETITITKKKFIFTLWKAKLEKMIDEL